MNRTISLTNTVCGIALVLSLLACSSIPGCSNADPQASGDVTLPDGISTRLASDDRAGWLRDRTIEDNRDLLERYRPLTEGKFRKMASSPYNYFRGTANIYLRDMTQPGFHAFPTSYGTPESSHVLLVGDPHPENIGTFRTSDDRMAIDFNDFDGSTYGSYHLDVRRLALGFYVLGELNAEVLSPEQRAAMVRGVVQGYVDEIARQSAGEETSFVYERGLGQRQAGVILGDLIRRAERDGDIREELDEYAPLADDRQSRHMFYGVFEESDVDGVIRDELVEPTQEERARVEQWMRAYPSTLVNKELVAGGEDALHIKGVSRRLGAGVSSYPVQRYYVLTEGESESLEDDLLLEIKEILDPPPLDGLPAFGLREFGSNGERVVRAQRALQHTDANDPLLGWSTPSDASPLSVRIRHRTKYQKGVDVARISEELADGEITPEDVIELATRSGILLAASHARTKTLQGKPALEVIDAALSKDMAGFVDESTSFVEAYGPSTLEDFDRFRAMVILHGTTLGYRFDRPME